MQGRQVGRNVRPAHSAGPEESQYRALSINRHARWSSRPYFRRAVNNLGRVQVTRPCMSISSGVLSVTVTVACRDWNDELRLLCGDLHWPQVV